MADRVTKTGVVEQRFVLSFDNAPTIKQLMDACRAVDTAERGAVLKVVRGPNDTQVQNPTRLVFSMVVSTDTDVPIV